MEFAQVLRERRIRSRLSQLDLAIRAGTTQRHISFMESGRSAPGRGMVVRLAESLELPLRERNGLLLSAGFAPVYPETDLKDPALAPIRTALDGILTGHLPYPAVVVDRHGDLAGSNAAFTALFGDVDAGLLAPPANVYRLALHPRGVAPRIVNFGEWATHILERLRQETERHPDARLAELRAELETYVPPEPASPGHLGFAVPLRLRSPRGELRLITTVTTFATAVDVTIAELKLEAFLPADAATAAALTASLAGTPLGGPEGG
ncbi:helix-turn-helix domain-containing protein [Sphaerisporangium siamense]|uniref:Transcriptional regulator with XRE-family HTH domain n=1 Tax=Sphaerisporangium siamense TaxID=795645 RepID=A0A7W7D5X6_9ACTN|nr:helix-turn-helix transcriptional regulator [Sphaerisporangium siamense]MBB4700782.1 transcriptional regulator with XRE-family HTH domain [Sphaerisporangium siamense]